MTDTTQQAAVDAAQAPAQQGATDGQNAQAQGDDLDTLLAEFDQGQSPAAASTQPAQQQATGDDLKVVAEEVRAWRTERQQETFKRDMGETIKKVRGDLDAELFDDSLVRGYVNARADEDPRLAQAWVNRHTNPKAFNRVVEQLGREFRQKWSKMPDRQATEDHAAVTAAVRSASTRAPDAPPPDFSRMSNSEFQAEKDKLFG